MDKDKAMKVMAESHRETVEELEEHLRIANQYVKKEREINLKLMKQIEFYRDAINNIKQTWKKADNIYNHVEMIHEIVRGLEVRDE